MATPAIIQEIQSTSMGSFYKQISPLVWKQSGWERTFVCFDDSRYRVEAILSADQFPMKVGFNCFALNRENGERIPICRRMNVQTLSFAPFLSCEVWFMSLDYGYIEMPTTTRYAVSMDGQEGKSHSANGLANALLQIGNAYGFRMEQYNRSSIYEPETASDMRFFHCLLGYGFNNCVFIEYRFDDLLNMDITKLDKVDAHDLMLECKQNTLLKKSLNFDVFKRPLTDIEKVECTKKFFKQYSRFIKRKQFSKFINNNYATSKY